MLKVDVMVRPNQDGWWAEVTSLPGCFSHGDTLEELKTNIREAIDLHLEGLIDSDENTPDELLRGEYDLNLRINIQDLFEHFPITVKGVSERAGINRTLLNQYVKGDKTMSEKQAVRIMEAINKIGNELVQLHL